MKKKRAEGWRVGGRGGGGGGGWEITVKKKTVVKPWMRFQSQGHVKYYLTERDYNYIACLTMKL